MNGQPSFVIMLQRKSIVISAVMLVTGLAIGFVLRPVVDPVTPNATGVSSGHFPVTIAGARGTQNFAANLDEARKIIVACREGSIRGDECAHAEQAVVTADARANTKRFLGNRPR